MATTFDLDREALAEFCRAHQIRKLSLFGSVLHGTNRPDSDLDLLVEFEPDLRIGLFAFGSLEVALSELTGSRVDLRTPEDLSPYFRPDVEREAEVLYEAA
jgi:predicted nucleotidyltransferase